MANKDFYIILGVSRTESPSGIRDAFRELAKIYHPDRSGPQTTQKLQEIAEAYEVLSLWQRSRRNRCLLDPVTNQNR